MMEQNRLATGASQGSARQTSLARQANGGSGWQGSPPPPPEKSKKRYDVGLVLAVQSIACVVALLLALLLRYAGGDAYEQLRRSFQESLQRNDLLLTLAALWDGDPIEAVSSAILAENEGAAPDGSASDSGIPPLSAPDSTVEEDNVPSEEGDGVPAPTGTAAQGRLPPAGAMAVALRVNRVACAPIKNGVISSGYGYRCNPTGQGEQFHRGLDIAAPAGTPIAAMFWGQVNAVGESASLGQYVVLGHGDGVEVLYAHCSAVLVQEGTVLRAGETVALVGASGDATGPHLHVQISHHGVVYNPVAIVPTGRYA